MRKAATILIGSLLLAGAPAWAATTEEAELTEALEGRTAGDPVKCLNLRDIRSTRIIDDTAILYETGGGTLYVNRPESGKESLDQWDVLVTDTHSSRLCNIDVVKLFDSSTRMMTGLVFLGDFVPYERPDED